MKSFNELMKESMKKISMKKKGVFGLTSVQAFFAIILGVALLAYVIVVIMGTLNSSSILTSGTLEKNQTTNILMNVSGGISSFFASINPVYAILAILVIILVLVVLVRVVSGSTGGAPASL
jgi:hypothetical protein